MVVVLAEPASEKWTHYRIEIRALGIEFANDVGRRDNTVAWEKGMTTRPMVREYIGTAGWSIPKAGASAFPTEGSHLERYAQRLTAVEINSCFYRHHKPTTYQRWRESTPDRFRFSVKLPKVITHEQKLAGGWQDLELFLAATSELREKRGPVLIQTPPSLAFREPVGRDFFERLRSAYDGPAAFEPRHASWFGDEATALLEAFDVARVAADPAILPIAARPGGSFRLVYYRFHGSPDIYLSQYEPAVLTTIGTLLDDATQRSDEVWCIFDNTSLGHATGDALTVLAARPARLNPDHELETAG